MVLIAMHEQETPLNSPNEQLDHTAPGLYYAERESEIRNRGVREGQGTATEQRPPERPFDGDQLGDNARHTVRSERSKSGCRCTSDIVSIDI